MKTRILTTVAFLCIVLNLIAQDGYSEKKDSLYSEILKQNRQLSIFLPEGYDAPGASFPVIYVLDADGRCQHTVPTARFLFLNNKMPKAIVVGVYNVDRNHDFLPTSTLNTPGGGGADNFLQFFKKELIPYIDKKLKTEHYNVLIGHSFGGTFVMHALLTEPDVFDAYIAIDPSFWYDNKLLVANAHNEFLKDKNWAKPLFITGREGGGMKDMAVADMDSLLIFSAPKELQWKVVAYENEDHGSVTFKSVYDGLRFIFDAGGNFMVYPSAGIIPPGTSTYALIENNNPNLRYTLGGAEPDFDSPVCPDTIRINKPCTLKVKSVSKKYGKAASMTRIFKAGEFIDGQKNIKKLRPGLKYSYYEGNWDSLPDFSKLKAIKTGVADSIDVKIALKKDSFAIQFEGYIQITEKALYNFWVVSDDGSKVYLNNQLLINNDGLHSAERPAVNMIPLNPGYYPLRIDMFEKTGGEALVFGYLIGSDRPVAISNKMFFHRE